MAAPVFAICENDECGTVWLNRNIVVGGGLLVGNRVGPCPKCGGLGAVPDGQYSEVSVVMFRPEQWRRIADALQAVKETISKGATADEVVRDIEENHPVLDQLKKFVPKNFTELTLLIGMLWAAANYLGGCDGASDATSIRIDRRAVEALERIADGLQTSPPSSPQGPQQESEDK